MKNSDEYKPANGTLAFRVTPKQRFKLDMLAEHYNRALSDIIRMGIDVILSSADQIIPNIERLYEEYEKKRKESLEQEFNGIHIDKKKRKRAIDYD